MKYEVLDSRRVLAAEFNFLGDFQTLPGKPAPANLTVVGSNVFFTATTDDKGIELWKTNGLVGGNVLMKDIWPGAHGSDATKLTNVGGVLYFVANDGTHGAELWKSDGTSSGTVLVADLTPGSAGTTIDKMTNFAGTLFFSASTSSGVELWKSNGTAAGTTIVKDIYAGSFSSYPNYLTVMGSTLYFTANDGINGTEIWKTDGTQAGTAIAVELSSGSTSSNPKNLTNVNGKLVFGTLSDAVAVSDGTTAGTTQISFSSAPSSFTNVNGTLYFTRSNSLWKSDLTQVGTTLVRAFTSAPTKLTAVGDTLFFLGRFSSGEDLGKSDGTAAGTVVVMPSVEPQLLTNVNGSLYFLADLGQLWRTDGTTAGSVLVKDYGVANNLAWITELVSIGNTVYFASHDKDMLRSDGTAASTVVISDGIAISASSSFGVSAERNGELFISEAGGLAYINTQGQLLRQTNSNPLNVSGTVYVSSSSALLKINDAGNREVIKAFRFVARLTNVNGTLYFSANDGTSGIELWKSDGTTAGTVLVKDIFPGAAWSYPRSLVNVNGTLYFTANDGTSGTEIWKSDGSAAGTTLVRDIVAGANGSAPEWLTAGGSTLFFTANDGTSGVELWRSDGTSTGTLRVSDINTGSGSSTPQDLTFFNGLLYFSASTTANGRELWTTNSTFVTAQVLDILPGTGNADPRYFTEVGGSVYFAATSAAGRELWKTNGTAGGTSQVRDILSGAKGSMPEHLINFNGTLYFSANDGTFGYQLWKSNGTSAGTVPIQNPDGARTPEIGSGLWVMGNRLFFGGRTQLYGTELFVLSDSDFGDAPNLTTFAQNGARHTAIGPLLGTLRDATEPNGLAGPNASGDDTNGVDDEDLFSGPIVLDRSSTVNLTINVAGATGNTRLNGWFDWNMDGDWDDANEKITSDFVPTNGANTIPVTVPAGSASGIGMSRWRISEQAGLGSTGWAYTGEVEDHPFTILSTIALTLPNTVASDIVIRRSGSFVQVVDRPTSNVLASELLTSLLGIVINGSDAQSEQVLVDYAAGGFFGLPNGITLDGGGGNDSFSTKGTSSTAIVRTDSATVTGQSVFATSEGSTNNSLRVVNFESLNLTGLASFVAQTQFTIAAQAYTIESSSSVTLANATSLAGGSLTSTGIVFLPAAATLSGFGSVSSAFMSGAGARLQLTGNMSIGRPTSPVGFDFGGVVDIGSHTLTLHDSDGAGLFATVTVGTNGKLIALQGLTLGAVNTITGSGTVETGSTEATALNNLGSITGASTSAPIVLNGYAIGTGRLANVEIRGQLNPGAPTMITNYGAMTYMGTLALDLRGNVPGSGYDQVVHSGNVVLGGTLNVALGNGFTPSAGTQFTLLRTTGTLSGQFSTLQLPAPVAGRNWEVGYTSNSVVLQLLDLALTLNPNTIAENGNSTTGTVTRNSLNLTSAVEVTLTSSDTTEATVPATVTIPAGAASATFLISSVDDTLLDGSQTVSITASAAGYGSDSENLVVTDVETLSLAISAAVVMENSGTVTATVTRHNTDLNLARIISLSSNDVTEVNVPATVTIPAGQASVDFSITIVDDNLLDGTQTAIVTAQSSGYVSASKSIDVQDLETLTLTILQTTVSESGGTTQARIARNNTNIAAAQTINLLSSDTSEATVPAQVTIPAGAAFTVFQITAVDDTLLDGPQVVTISATATGYQSEAQALTVTDHETLGLALSLSSISENGGTTIGTVTRNNTDIAQPLVVTLTSSDTSEANVPTSVTIAANESSATFTVTAVDDNLLDGSQSISISAAASGYGTVSKPLVVLDSELLQVSIDRSSISEKGGSALGTVRRTNSDTGTALAVQVSSSDTTEASVPSIVIIPATSDSATFTISAIDDALLDGTQSLTINVSAIGYVPASSPLSITDYETLTVSFALPAISENGGSTIGTVTRSNTDIAAPLTVQLQSTDTTEATVPATVTIPAGQASATFIVNAVDDQLQDGTQTVTILAQANGYVDGTQSIDVIDSVSLSLSISPPSISENGGTATGTVTRSNSNVEGPLTVSLMTSDLTEATVPTSVVIPAGRSSTTFLVTAVDDTLLDGSQVVNLTAAAAGYASASRSLTILDFEQLQLTIDATTISESGGTTRGRVTRLNTDIGTSLTIQLTSSDMSEAIAPATVTIPANQTTVTFDISAIDDTLLDGLQAVTLTAAAVGYQSADASLSVSDSESLTLQLAVGAMSEKGGQLSAIIRRSNTDVSQPLTVSLVNGDASEASLPQTVVIPANESSALFLINGVDDDLLDGAQTVTIQAGANGYVSATANLSVLDHETLSLTSITNRMSESGGRIMGTILRSNTDTAAPLLIQLSTTDATEATVPLVVTIPANAASATFEVTAVDDQLLDGAQAVAIVAHSAGYVDGSLQMSVDDHETLTVSVASNTMSEEGGAIVARVTRSNTDNQQPLTVGLISSDTTAATTPATVVIPAGQASIDFTVQAVDDNLLDGDQMVTITASESNYVSGSAGAIVTDIESLQINLSSLTMSEQSGVIQATITRLNTNLDQPLTVNLQSSDSSEASVPTNVVIPAGQAATTVDIHSVDDSLLDGTQSVAVTAASPGYRSVVGALSVTDAEALAITLTSNSISEAGGLAMATVTRSNTDNSLPLSVTLSSSDKSEATVPVSVTIPANQSSATFAIQAIDDTLLDGTQVVAIVGQAAGYANGSAQISITDVESLSVTLSKTSMREQSDFITATITRNNTDIAQPLDVSVQLDDGSEATVPTQITIPANASSVQFTIQSVDDDLLDGSQSVILSFTAATYISQPSQFVVLDYEQLFLSVDRSTVRESDGRVPATLTRSNSDIDQALLVQLTSSDPTELSVPTQITIPAGQASVQFLVDAVDDNLLDGSQSVELNAQAPGYSPGTTQLSIKDSESLTIQLSLLTISESGGQLTATVARSNSDIQLPLVVTIENSDTSELAAPTTVTIPAGQSSASFSVDAKDDTLLDGSQSVRLTALAAGYDPSERTIIVEDAEALTLSINDTSIPEQGGSATVTITRSNSDTQQPLQVNLTTQQASEISMPAMVTIPAGLASVQFAIQAVNDAVLDGLQTVVIFGSAAGYRSATGSIDIEDDERLFPWQNPRNALDVNDSGQVTALDALLVINGLNTRLVLTPTLPDPFDPVAYMDVNADGVLTPLDALLVINHLNTRVAGEGEKGSGLISFEVAAPSVNDDLTNAGLFWVTRRRRF